MIAIRGATTIERDCAEQIRESVKELLLQIKEQNGLRMEDIICIMFSNTADIRSYYPAKCAREAGFVGCALYSSVEPDIENSLKKCIRVMVLAEKRAQPKHIYLRGAKNLRKDLTKVMNIALDGPAGSGKSTVSKIIAKKLDILCLDTGAMYRACALKCVNCGVDCADESAVARVMRDINIEVKYSGGGQITCLDGKDVSSDIRKNEISLLASAVSAHPCVRSKMVELQRRIAKNTSCILDGRDIGSNVLPDADFKFYLTASPEVRAERRRKELEERGTVKSFDELLKEIKQRDEQDKNRKVAPLVVAKDAQVIDSSALNIDEVVNIIITKIQEKI